MKLRYILRLCTLLNFSFNLIILAIVYGLASNVNYLNVGWNDNFVVMFIHINTWWKYLGLMLLVSCIGVINSLMKSLAEPLLWLFGWDPEKKVIYGITRVELFAHAQIIYGNTAFREILMVLVNIAQIDVALVGLFIYQCTAGAVYWRSIAKKTFIPEEEEDLEDPKPARPDTKLYQEMDLDYLEGINRPLENMEVIVEIPKELEEQITKRGEIKTV